MNILSSKCELEWTEPKIFYKLKRKIEKKSFIKRFKLGQIILFFMFFVIGIVSWSNYGKIAKIRMGFLGAILVCMVVSAAMLYIIFLLNRLGGKHISLCGKYVYIQEGDANPKQWNCENIHACKILNGIYKHRKYTAFVLIGKKGLLEIIFLSDRILPDKVIRFFKKNGIECISENSPS